MLLPTIDFFIALHIVAFVRVLMLEKTGIAPSSSISIAVAALILSKAVLIADMLPMINRFPHKPLTYNIARKTVIYLLISAVIHYLERLFDFWRETGGLSPAIESCCPNGWAIISMKDDRKKIFSFEQ